ncbi:hypothetical protein PSTG_14321 [Puccinia striiformis f. sp. tritici PST-78]|uniref:Uncharacterized protein n=1 Tax=Puccinia striiformis f. sp. tritici PST-78 TaxID=1165861 RepID=A0A0L0UZV4_9BASI|nr:hypothetical protein PSTG_14321 [Puccinia striiformis f. sp. tritici PST-78]
MEANLDQEGLARLDELRCVGVLLEEMMHKYDVPREDDGSDERDPNLTIDDMGEKAKIWERLESNLLPSIEELLSSLLSALDLHDSDTHPSPDFTLTRKILSNLDETLENTASLAISFSLRSPLPDGKHDHHMKHFKTFRSSQIRMDIWRLMGTIFSVFRRGRNFLEFYAASIVALSDPEVLQEVSNSRRDLHWVIARVGDSIRDIIKWYRKPDWAILQEDWLMIVSSCNTSFQYCVKIFDHPGDPTPDLNNLTIDPAEEVDLIVNDANIRTEGDASFRDALLEMTRLTITFVKLTRIWAKKALKMIPKGPVFELDTEINSETMNRLRNAFHCISGALIFLSQDLEQVYWRNRAISIANRDSIHSSVLSLSEGMESCLSDLNPYLVSSRSSDNNSIESDYEEWSLTLEQEWKKAVDRLSGLIVSLEIDPEQQPEPEQL